MNIVQNLQVAIDTITAIPEADINLASFKSPCGTIACSVGWLASTPYFQQLGLTLVLNDNTSEYHRYKLVGPESDEHDWSSTRFDWVDELFGPNAFRRLFDEYGSGQHDDFLLHNNDMTDKELAIPRLENQLKDVLTVR